MADNDKRKIVVIAPEKSSVHLSEEILFYLLMQVPEGRLTRREDMEAYLADCFHVHHVWIERTAFSARIISQPGYLDKILDCIPRHREVSTGGYILHPLDQVEKLQKEGFEILPPTRKGYSPRVKDFKKYLFDFSKEMKVDTDVLSDINTNGLQRYLPDMG